MAHDLTPLAGLRRARPFWSGALLVGLWSVWVSRTLGQAVPTIQLWAEIGEGFFNEIVFTQLSLVLLAAPAATAGTICQDRSSGGVDKRHVALAGLTRCFHLRPSRLLDQCRSGALDVDCAAGTRFRRGGGCLLGRGRPRLARAGPHALRRTTRSGPGGYQPLPRVVHPDCR